MKFNLIENAAEKVRVTVGDLTKEDMERYGFTGVESAIEMEKGNYPEI